MKEIDSSFAIETPKGKFPTPLRLRMIHRKFLAGHGPGGFLAINPFAGAPQADIFFHYKTDLIKTTAADRATRDEEQLEKKEKRFINPENINLLTAKHLTCLPYKTSGCRYLLLQPETTGHAD